MDWLIAFRYRYGFVPTALWVDKPLYKELSALAWMHKSLEMALINSYPVVTCGGIPVYER